MKIVCKKCGQAKDEKQFKHKHYAPTMCLDCRKERQRDYNKKNERLNRTKWMDIIIGRN